MLNMHLVIEKEYVQHLTLSVSDMANLFKIKQYYSLTSRDSQVAVTLRAILNSLFTELEHVCL